MHLVMKSNKYIALIFILLVILISSCKNKSTESVNEIKKQLKFTKEIPKNKYAIKSGIVEYKTEMMGMAAKQVFTFDDYGKKEITEVIMEMLGTKVHTVALTINGYIYNYDLINKKGTKKPVTLIKTTDIDFENMTEKMIKDMNLKKEGTEIFLGKNCEKVSIDNKSMQMKGTYLIYKGIPLKVNTDLGTMKMNLLAEKFIENPTIPEEKFVVPEEVIIAETDK